MRTYSTADARMIARKGSTYSRRLFQRDISPAPLARHGVTLRVSLYARGVRVAVRRHGGQMFAIHS